MIESFLSGIIQEFFISPSVSSDGKVIRSGHMTLKKVLIGIEKTIHLDTE